MFPTALGPHVLTMLPVLAQRNPIPSSDVFELLLAISGLASMAWVAVWLLHRWWLACYGFCPYCQHLLQPSPSDASDLICPLCDDPDLPGVVKP